MAQEETRKYYFGEESIDAPADMSVEEVRGVWAECFSAITNAEAIENDDGSVTFALRAGTKG